MSDKVFPPITAGEVLLEEFLRPMGISQYRLAKSIGVPPRRINEIVHGKGRITPDTGTRIAKAFGMGERFFLDLQLDYDLAVEKETYQEELDAITPLVA